MTMYAVVYKHKYAKEWDLDRIESMALFSDKSEAITHLQDTNAKSIADHGEETHEIKEIQACGT